MANNTEHQMNDYGNGVLKISDTVLYINTGCKGSGNDLWQLIIYIVAWIFRSDLYLKVQSVIYLNMYAYMQEKRI